MCSFTVGPRRSAWSLILAVLLVVITPLAPALANPARTDLRIEVQADTAGGVTVTGALVDASGHGVPGATVSAAVAGQLLQNATTAGDGSLSMQFQVPQNLLQGQQELVISYKGDSQYAGASQAYTIDFGNAAAPPGGATKLTLNVDKTQAHAGDLLDLSGTLSLTTGEAVSSGTITFSFRGTVVPESATHTGNDGSYSTVLEIPIDAEAGEGQLVATFSGAANLETSTATQTITIKVPEATTPAAKETTPAAETAEASPSVTASPSLSASAAADDSQAVNDNGVGALALWFLGAAVVVVAAGALTLLFVVSRPRRREADEADVVGLIGDPEPDEQSAAAPVAQPVTQPPTTPSPAATMRGSSPSAPAQPQTEALSPDWFREGEARTRQVAGEDPSEVETTLVRPRPRNP